VPCPPESLEDQFGEGRNLGGELGRDSIFDGHMRAVTAGRTEALAGQKSLGGQRRNCVEVAMLPGDSRAVRDSKDPGGPKLMFSRDEWRAFTACVKRGELGLD
jgi:hypothetical protein